MIHNLPQKSFWSAFHVTKSCGTTAILDFWQHIRAPSIGQVLEQISHAGSNWLRTSICQIKSNLMMTAVCNIMWGTTGHTIEICQKNQLLERFMRILASAFPRKICEGICGIPYFWGESSWYSVWKSSKSCRNKSEMASSSNANGRAEQGSSSCLNKNMSSENDVRVNDSAARCSMQGPNANSSVQGSPFILFHGSSSRSCIKFFFCPCLLQRLWLERTTATSVRHCSSHLHTGEKAWS